jgi:hypothetical protein
LRQTKKSFNLPIFKKLICILWVKLIESVLFCFKANK